jgi:hypothetical protein
MFQYLYVLGFKQFHYSGAYIQVGPATEVYQVGRVCRGRSEIDGVGRLV